MGGRRAEVTDPPLFPHLQRKKGGKWGIIGRRRAEAADPPLSTHLQRKGGRMGGEWTGGQRRLPIPPFRPFVKEREQNGGRMDRRRAEASDPHLFPPLAKEKGGKWGENAPEAC